MKVRILERVRNIIRFVRSLDERLHRVQQALGRIESRQLNALAEYDWGGNEFRVYSQWGEDGLIQRLINKVKIERPIFIEFGVENYTEANTRYLLINNNWSGLVIDGSEENIRYIRRDPIYWQYNLRAECAFVDREIINKLILDNGISGDIGLLSVDIDGNDYWIWKAIDAVNPRIVICEYNSLWGASRAVTTPYDPAFVRSRAHYSNLYYGASIGALVRLGRERGYSLIGSNRAGNNVFFVRDDLLADMVAVSPEKAWAKSGFRESRDASGRLTFLSHSEQLALVADMPLVSLDDGVQYKVRDLICSKRPD